MAVSLLIFNTDKKNYDNCQILMSLSAIKNTPEMTSQILLVQSLGTFKAQITICQRQDNTWRRVLAPPFPGVIGKEGIAFKGQKKEGDLKTPAGLYSIGTAFGTQPVALKMDFKYITAEDKFIDDVSSKNYNTWVTSETDAKSYERMLIPPYKLGAVINYNMKPIVPGAGSAIFMHLWRSHDKPTNGCVAMDEPHLKTILHWLDKRQHPYIYISERK